MKQAFLFTALSAALLFSNHSQAQVPVVSKILPKVMIGLKVGANFQQLDGGLSDKSYNPGIVGGAFVGVTKGKIGVQVEGLIKTVKFSNSGSSGYINGVYIDIPALFQYKLVSRLWIQAGPQFSMLATAKDNASADVKNKFKSSEVSGVVGLQAILPMHFVAGARYIMGFTDVNNTTAAGAWKNRSIQLYLGFRFL
jgi:hypothetical protein